MIDHESSLNARENNVKGSENNILQELREVLGEDWVSSNPSVLENYRAAYEINAGKRMEPEIVVFPSSDSEVKKVIDIAEKYAVPMLSIGKYFDHTGERNAEHGGVLMDLRRMDIVGG